MKARHKRLSGIESSPHTTMLPSHTVKGPTWQHIAALQEDFTLIEYQCAIHKSAWSFKVYEWKISRQSRCRCHDEPNNVNSQSHCVVLCRRPQYEKCRCTALALPI